MNENKKIEGSNLMLFYNSKSIAFATNHTLSINVQSVTTTSKQSGGKWVTRKPQAYSWSITSEHLYSQDEADTLFTLMDAGAAISVIFGVKAQTAKDLSDAGLQNWTPDENDYLTGNAYITALQVEAPVNERARLSITLEGNGAISPPSGE